jgi:phosphatidate cytidylyltransferase
VTPRDGVGISSSAASAPQHDLALRVASAVVLAPLALGTAYVGGWSFAAFWAAAALAVWWEWDRLVDPAGSRGAYVTGACALVIELLLLGTGRTGIALLIAFLGALAAAVMAAKNSAWVGAGVLYASGLLIAPVFIRDQSAGGFAAIVFLFAVVWATDICGYFAGRAIGGPKLAPSVSPKKTWAGAVGGMLGALAGGLAVAILLAAMPLLKAAVTALALSVVAQAGDLFESKVKRLFEAKDAGALIPGHGGVMDRVDGFVVAATALAVFMAVRGAPEMGFVLW